MRLTIRTNGVIPAAAARVAQQRLLFALGRFANRVRSLTVRLSRTRRRVETPDRGRRPRRRPAGRDLAGRGTDRPCRCARRADGIAVAPCATAVCGVNDVESA
jgi:hypothetical protein